jgi:hypothetical protein
MLGFVCSLGRHSPGVLITAGIATIYHRNHLPDHWRHRDHDGGFAHARQRPAGLTRQQNYFFLMATFLASVLNRSPFFCTTVIVDVASLAGIDIPHRAGLALVRTAHDFAEVTILRRCHSFAPFGVQDQLCAAKHRQCLPVSRCP